MIERRKILSGITCIILAPLLCGCAMQVEEPETFAFNDLSGWKLESSDLENLWKVVGDVDLDASAEDKGFTPVAGSGVLWNGPAKRSSNLYTEKEWGDLALHIEFNCVSQSNSGVYLMGLYEVQIKDNYDWPGDKPLRMRECGGIFGRWVDEKYVDGVPPRVNACKPPGEWQSFDIVFETPRFDESGKKIKNARVVEILHNGHVVQKDLELKGPTRGHLPGPERATGPILLQGNHGAIAFRNLTVTPR